MQIISPFRPVNPVKCRDSRARVWSSGVRALIFYNLSGVCLIFEGEGEGERQGFPSSSVVRCA
jgi:hypothetical protein